MAQRGRPKMSGGRKMHRDLTVLWSYNKSRRACEKHASAVAYAVAEVRKQFLGMKISETEVKRVLATYQPRGYAVTFIATKTPTGFSLGFGARPEYTRINAKKRP